MRFPTYLALFAETGIAAGGVLGSSRKVKASMPLLGKPNSVRDFFGLRGGGGFWEI
jgi:hypothetical protein